MKKLVLMGLLVLPVQASGQRVLRDAWSDLQQGAADIGYVWTAPLRLGTRDLPALGLVAGATGLTMVYDDNTQAWLRAHPQSAPVDALAQFRKGRPGEELGDIWMLIRASGVVWVAGLAVDSHTMREGALGCVSAGMAQSFARRNVVYKLVARTRPDSAQGPYEFSVPGKSEWKYKSFYGGHAANAMTCISFLSNRFDLGLAEPVLYALALGTGVARVVDGAHWSSDTVLGIAAGYTVGRMVANRVKSRAQARTQDGQEPGGLLLDYRADAVVLGWQVRF